MFAPSLHTQPAEPRNKLAGSGIKIVKSSTNPDHQPVPDQVTNQLKRIRGQIDGIIGMYQDERSCVDIVRQTVAAKNSLGRVARDLLSNEASRCSREHRPEDLESILKEVFKY